MSMTVARMTKTELQEMIGAIVEEKLIELFGDPDQGLSLRESLRQRLHRQKAAVARGERGEPFEEVLRRLDVVQAAGGRPSHHLSDIAEGEADPHPLHRPPQGRVPKTVARRCQV